MHWLAPSSPVEQAGPPQGDIRAEDVRCQLQRILASANFADSERLRALLGYLVEQELRGAGETLKEYVIGIDVLGKPDSFDPKADSVVRVQASRLRAKLKLYYATEGSADSLRIGLPLRSYRPAIERQTTGAVATRITKLIPMRGWRWVAAVSFALLAVAAAAWRIGDWRTAAPATGAWRRITFDTGSTCCPAVSRDGKLIAYASDRSGGDYDIYVQPADGSSPLRLTRHEARDYNPDISPDGTKVIFASYRDGGGIYMVPVLGGEETRIIDDGDCPRFSPDGAWIAFDREFPDGSYSIFVASATGGLPRRVTPESLVYGRRPVWSPDGQYLLFVGAAREKPKEFDFWAVPAAGGPPIRTGVSEALERQGLSRIQFFQPPHDWLGNQVVFSYFGGGTTHLWKIGLSTRTWKAIGRAEQLTSGGGKENFSRVAANASGKSTLVFSSGERPAHLWRLPVDSNRGLVTGPPLQLTHDRSMAASLYGTRPAVSADGSVLVYASRRWGTDDVWYHNLASGEEKALASSHLDETNPVVLRDGSAVAFARREASRQVILIASVGGGPARKVCDDCGAPADWSADGKYIVYISTAEELGLLDLTSGERRRLPSAHPVVGAALSPDGRWLALVVRIARKERGFLVPFPAERWPPGQEWAPLTNLEVTSFAWSPDGRMVYFPSVEDQYRCLWAQRLDPANGKPIGPSFAVKHFHTMQGYPQMVRAVAVARDSIILRLTHEKVNIWTMEMR